MVLLSGEPGIGKSDSPLRCWNTSLPSRTRACVISAPRNTPTALLSDHQPDGACRWLRTRRHRANKTRQARCLAGAELHTTPGRRTFAEMLSLPNDGRYPTLELTPQQRRQKTLEASLRNWRRVADKAVLMIFEDVHWIDPTSLEVFGRAVDRIRTWRVADCDLPAGIRPPWIGRPHVTALTLNRLGEREIAAMIDRVIGNKPLPANIRHDIIERTDGIPLFVEEMTKAVLEAEGEGEAQHTAAAVPSSALAVPATLHASLMARLDRLGPAKEVAQIGAAIGREFSHALWLRCFASRRRNSVGARSPGRGWFAVPAGRSSARDLSVQARAGAGRGLRHAATRAATRAACPHRQNS